MTEHCAQCLCVVEERLGVVAPNGETLCGPCYFALWDPKGHRQLSPATERRRPAPRRPKRGRPIWTPGPLGELDPQEPARRLRWRRRT